MSEHERAVLRQLNGFDKFLLTATVDPISWEDILLFMRWSAMSQGDKLTDFGDNWDSAMRRCCLANHPDDSKAAALMYVRALGCESQLGELGAYNHIRETVAAIREEVESE